VLLGVFFGVSSAASVETFVSSANSVVAAGGEFVVAGGEYAVVIDCCTPQLGHAGTASVAGSHSGQAGTAGLAGTQQIMPFLWVDSSPCAVGAKDNSASTISAATMVALRDIIAVGCGPWMHTRAGC